MFLKPNDLLLAVVRLKDGCCTLRQAPIFAVSSAVLWPTVDLASSTDVVSSEGQVLDKGMEGGRAPGQSITAKHRYGI